MAQKDLIPFQSVEEAKEKGRKGGIASGKARLRKKHGRELVQAMLALGVTDEKVKKAMRVLGYTDKTLSNELVMHARQIEKAQKKGDTTAYNAVMKAAGYDTLNINQDTPSFIVVSSDAIQAAGKWSSKKGDQQEDE